MAKPKTARTKAKAKQAGKAKVRPGPIAGLLERMRAAEALPVPHPAAPAAWWHAPPWWAGNAGQWLLFVQEYARITGTLTVPLGCGCLDGLDQWSLYSNQQPPSFYYSPYTPGTCGRRLRRGDYSSGVGTWLVQELEECVGKLLLVRKFIANHADRKIWVLLDSESLWPSPDGTDRRWDMTVDTLHSLTFMVFRWALPSARIVWFGRGRERQPDYFAGGELHDNTYSDALYDWQHPKRMERRLRGLLDRAEHDGVKHVVPWITLGWAFEHGGDDNGPCDYDRAFSRRAGQIILAPEHRDEIPAVAIWPAITRQPWMIEHLLAYAEGAAGN